MEAATMRQRRDLSDLTGLRTGVYLRVSRADQADKAALDAERSTATQRRVFEEWAERTGVTLADEYPDPDISASRFASKKNRPEFERMVADVEAGKLDILWFWEISRQQRRLDVFAGLRNLCRDHGVLWVIRDRVADPANSKDMLSLGIQSMIAEDESENLSIRVFDGKESSAVKGKRAGRFPYGYKRGPWHPETETFGPDEPDVFDGNGAVEDSPAYVVREIFDQIKAGHSVTGIRHDLNERGIRAPAGIRWSNSTIRYIAMNPAYAGMRVRHIEKGAGLSTRAGKILNGVQAKWPPLVDTETFWAVYRLLADPARITTKPHRPGGRLLSAVARCGECGAKLTVRNKNQKQGHRDDVYACAEKSCVGIYISDLDDHVEQEMVRWLSNPDVAAALAGAGDTGAAALARADLDRAETELREWHRLAEHGEISPAGYAAAEKGILARITDARQRIDDAEVPPFLKGNIGPMAAAGWKALDTPVKRQIIAVVADIRVLKVGRHGNRLVPAAARVEWRWLLGDRPGEGAGDREGVIRAHHAAHDARLAERRTKVTHLRANGWTRPMIARELGMSVSLVGKDLAVSRRAD